MTATKPRVPAPVTEPIDLRHKRGRRSWRFLADEGGDFRSVSVHHGRTRIPPKKIVMSKGHVAKVVDNPRRDDRSGHILFAQSLGYRSYYIDVAGISLWVWVEADGSARISNSEDRRESTHCRQLDLRDPKLDEPKVSPHVAQRLRAARGR